MARWFADEADLAQWAGPEIDFPLTPGNVETWIAESSGGRPRSCFAVTERDDVPIGHFQLVHDARNKMVRIGRFAIAPEKRRTGFGAALFGTIVEKAFSEFDAHRVELGVWTSNTIARRLYEKAGFVREGTLRDTSFVGGRWYSTDNMSLLRPEWAKRKSPATATVA